MYVVTPYTSHRVIKNKIYLYYSVKWDDLSAFT